MRKLTKEELKKYSYYLTVGGLKKFLQEYNLPDDALVVIQRIHDVYYDKHDWGVYCKENEHTYSARKFNKDIDEGLYLDKEQYPLIDPEKHLIKHKEEDIENSKSEYTPAWSCVYYKEDSDILFIDLHY